MRVIAEVLAGIVAIATILYTGTHKPVNPWYLTPIMPDGRGGTATAPLTPHPLYHAYRIDELADLDWARVISAPPDRCLYLVSIAVNGHLTQSPGSFQIALLDGGNVTNPIPLRYNYTGADLTASDYLKEPLIAWDAPAGQGIYIAPGQSVGVFWHGAGPVQELDVLIIYWQ